MFLVVNFVAFQIAWLSSVIGGAQQMPWLGPLAVFGALALHFKAARRPLEEFMLVMSCAMIGAVFDSFLVISGWVQYSSGLFNAMVAPYWIITMWMLFATTLNVSMRWLRGNPKLAALFGAFGGPTTYIAGEKLGGIELTHPLAALIALGVGWAVMMPILLKLSTTFDGMAREPALRKVWVAERQEW